MRYPLALFLCLATAAAAHQGVQNADVRARMALMEEVGSATKVLGDMAKGRISFDPAAANVARLSLAKHAGQTPAAFENGADDPKSEAKRVIWDEWDTFVGLSRDMARAAERDIKTTDDLRQTLRALGQTCQSCHERYRD